MPRCQVYMSIPPRQSWQFYLLAKPNAPDAQQVQSEIYSLQYDEQHPPYLGIVVGEVGADQVKHLGLSDANGAVVERVVQGGPAAQAGLEVGDISRAFNGQIIASPAVLNQMIIATPSGTSVTLEVWRDDKLMTMPVQIAARP